ncbi:MAG TPA: histidinol-phosphatase [Caulobacteraceae bacterium]|jgi:histidinol phosphatase-like enzyme (inositol monophosphatase family)
MADDLSRERVQALDAFILQLGAAAAEVILPLFRADHGVENKAAKGFDPVTRADRDAESALRRAIAARFPEHGVIGEEHGDDRADAEFVWVLDPIDGTRSFICGLPLWTTLIGLRFQGSPVLGLIAQPYLREFYVGTPVYGSRLITPDGEQRLEVRPCEALTQATLLTTDAGLFDGPEAGAWTQVRSAARLTRFGCDAYAYAQLAAGHVDLVVESGLQVWDTQALVPVIEGAGGLVCNWRGERLGSGSGQIAAAGDPRVLKEALVALRRSTT